MGIIEVINVKKDYYTSRGKIICQALKGLNLSIEKGGFVAIAGPSGSGKTTLLNLIGCLDTPTEGEILIEGEKVTNFGIKQLTQIRRKKIGFIFQTFNLIPSLSVYENIELPLLFSDICPKVRRNKVEKIIELVGLNEVSFHRVVDISGGQQQRVGIARAIIKDPVIVLADEPTGNLDSETSKVIIELMKKLNRESGVSFIFSTHDPLVMEYADKLYKLKDGQIV